MTDELRIAHLRIAHLRIAQQGSNPEVGNPEIHLTYQSIFTQSGVICLDCNSSSFVSKISKFKGSGALPLNVG